MFTLHTEPCLSMGWRQMGGNQCDADWTTPKHKKTGMVCEEESRAHIFKYKCHLLINAPSVLTFPGILAASTERQFTQEAITSTGGLMTDVNLINDKQ